jgi:hypothetical protein
LHVLGDPSSPPGGTEVANEAGGSLANQPLKLNPAPITTTTRYDGTWPNVNAAGWPSLKSPNWSFSLRLLRLRHQVLPRDLTHPVLAGVLNAR